ncbi:myeloperoxidase-like [Haliotis cracherodii]|uniref:myeloperoxidase-like n=1 Tax=Haliotis cracherodii TaxID=6455 RepID=UPI0039ECDE24
MEGLYVAVVVCAALVVCAAQTMDLTPDETRTLVENVIEASINKLYEDEQRFYDAGVDFHGGSSALYFHSVILNTKTESLRLGAKERQRLYALKSIAQITAVFGEGSLSEVASHVSTVLSGSSSLFMTLFQDEGICPTDEVVTCDPNTRYRKADGSCNNLRSPRWGKSFIPSRRFMPPEYNDGISEPRANGRDGNALPNPRLVSRTLHASDEDLPDSASHTHLVMQWGQFIDHDTTSTPIQRGNDESIITCCIDDIPPGTPQVLIDLLEDRDVCFSIPIPEGDETFTDRTCLNFVRSIQVPNADCEFEPVEQLNQVTAFVDGSTVYGSTQEEQDALRLHKYGLLDFQDDQLELLPNSDVQNCIPEELPESFCFLAGDERVNEQTGLTSMHTIWMRQHNRIARGLSRLNPHWDDEWIFQETRKIVGAMIQKITYEEFLPVLLNKKTIKFFRLEPSERGYRTVYNENSDPSIRSAFSSAAYRLGHTLIRGTLSKLTSPYEIQGEKTLRSLFGNASLIVETRGQTIPWLLGGMTRDHARTFDRFLTPDVTNNLFLDRNGNSFDLASLNIQRGRDHGIPGYNAWRRWCKLPAAENFGTGFNGLVDHPSDAARLLGQLYSHPDDIDLFPGAISERPLPGGVVGATIACIIGNQFQLLKEGDRFWYETAMDPVRFSVGQSRSLQSVTIAKVVCVNARLPVIQPDALHVADYINNPLVRCKDLPDLDLAPWKEAPALWSDWSGWSRCIAGMQRRHRVCRSSYTRCSGPDIQRRRCRRFPYLARYGRDGPAGYGPDGQAGYLARAPSDGDDSYYG